jgi:hypothetical protein
MRAGRLLSAISIGSLSVSFVGVLPCLAQRPTPAPTSAVHTARILGVYDQDTGEPIEGVRVSDLLSGTYALTTKTGTVALSFLPGGGGFVRVQKIGYQVQTMFVAITPGDTAPLTIVLPRLTELPGVVTTADSSHFLSPMLRAFEERRHAGAGGYFIGEDVLRKYENSTVGNMVRRFPGTTLILGPEATWLMPTARCNDGSHPGPPQVYLDGVAWTPPMRPDAPRINRKDYEGTAFNLDEFQITELAGIEFYPDNAVLPVAFTHNAQRCGALYLWTRER